MKIAVCNAFNDENQGTIKRNLSSEEIARPRRSTPTPELLSKKAPEDPAVLAPLFGPPLESAFEEQKLEAPIDQPEVWGSVQPENPSVESANPPRPFPAGTPPPLPPKNIPATPPRTGSPLTVGVGNDQTATEVKSDKLPSINDLDSIFGPVISPMSVAANVDDKNTWISFSDPSPENVTPEVTSREKVVSPPVASETPDEPPGAETFRNVPSPLNLEEVQKKVSEQTHVKDDNLASAASPKDFGVGQRATPPPPPPPTYRTVVSSPGPNSGGGTGSTSGSSSPAHPATPLAVCSSPTPPPPPPRPPSRTKLPPGKPGIGDMSRPFSPPIHSSSPPPIAPLARAESTSSISSTNSLSAATTPTIGKKEFFSSETQFL
uniref:Uncharacterized protein n=1 Tax=Sphaerodactylus townsendi TaxID=933632 RepID=A0ACB8F3Q8_9SAUR